MKLPDSSVNSYIKFNKHLDKKKLPTNLYKNLF